MDKQRQGVIGNIGFTISLQNIICLINIETKKVVQVIKWLLVIESLKISIMICVQSTKY